MYVFPRSLSNFAALPEDVLLEVCHFLEAEDIFSLRQTCKRIYEFTRCRHLWYQLSLNLCYRMPLAIPPLRSRSSITTQEYEILIKKGLRLENNWRSERPMPFKPPRYLPLVPPKTDSGSNSVMMLRLLPGGRLFLLITTDGQLTCRDVVDGRKVGEWKHGGIKVHSIDVDVVDDGQAMILTVSVDRPVKGHDSIPGIHHMVHVLRIDVTETPDAGLSVNFVHIMASPWDTAWWIVSVEGDIIAAYSCDLDTKPLSQFVVWIANWRTATAAVVHLPENIINLETWPTLQVVGGQVIIHEERGYSPASIVFPVPDTLFSTESTDPLPHVKITPTLILDGDHEDNAYQTRFSKLWRNAPLKNAKSRPLSLFSISTSVDGNSKRTISVQTFDPFPIPSSFKQPLRSSSESSSSSRPNHQPDPRPSSQSSTSKPNLPRSKIWRRTALVPESQEGLRFTFCLGRYGSFPIWVEEDDPPEDLADGMLYIPELRLMGLFTEYKEHGECHIKQLEVPDGVKLDELQCLDFDDAEGVLCGVTDMGVWIIEYA